VERPCEPTRSTLSLSHLSLCRSLLWLLQALPAEEGDGAAAMAARRFYTASNERDIEGAVNLMATDVAYEDLQLFSDALLGHAAVREMFDDWCVSLSLHRRCVFLPSSTRGTSWEVLGSAVKLHSTETRVLPPAHTASPSSVGWFSDPHRGELEADVLFVVDDVTQHGEGAAGVLWHLEVGGIPMPFSRGCSFYRFNAEVRELTDGEVLSESSRGSANQSLSHYGHHPTRRVKCNMRATWSSRCSSPATRV
jgi:hypothetical protein